MLLELIGGAAGVVAWLLAVVVGALVQIVTHPNHHGRR